MSHRSLWMRGTNCLRTFWGMEWTGRYWRVCPAVAPRSTSLHHVPSGTVCGAQNLTTSQTLYIPFGYLHLQFDWNWARDNRVIKKTARVVFLLKHGVEMNSEPMCIMLLPNPANVMSTPTTWFGIKSRMLRVLKKWKEKYSNPKKIRVRNNIKLWPKGQNHYNGAYLDGAFASSLCCISGRGILKF